jgi:NADPH:quinone reductase-like Zn-dependent oxidoreductase
MLGIVSSPDADSPTELIELPEPIPAPHEAIVAVRAFSINRGEIRLLALRPNAWRPGQDIAGVVVQRAADGSGPPEGSRVVALLEQGGWAQRVAVPTARIATLPDSVRFAAAAILPIAGLTALRSLRLGGSLLGRCVLITGASGGVGQFAVQLATRAGASVTGVVRSDTQREMIIKLGATAAITDMADLGAPFDVVIESVGGAAFREAIRLIKPDGTIVLIGSSSGEDSRFQIYDFFGHEGVRLLIFFSYHEPEKVSADLTTLVALVADGSLTPQIGIEAGWRDLNAALRALRDRQLQGKAVLHVDTAM